MDVMDITLETLLTVEIPDCLVCEEETVQGSFYCSYHLHVLGDESLEAAMGWVHQRQEEIRSEADAAEHEAEQAEDEYALHLHEEWRSKWHGTKVEVAHMIDLRKKWKDENVCRKFLVAKATYEMGPVELITLGRLLYWLELHDVLGLYLHVASLTIKDDVLEATWDGEPTYGGKKMLDLAWEEQGGDRVDHSNHWSNDVPKQTLVV